MSNQQLARNDAALEYLGSRGLGRPLPPPRARYAPSGWRGLCDHLNRQGVDDARLVRANLGMTTSRGAVVERLPHRIVFPVRDEDRQPVGFTGRAAPGSSDAAPKYLDTLERGVKSRVLHGLGLLEQGAVPVLVEGPVDRLAVSIVGAGPVRRAGTRRNGADRAARRRPGPGGPARRPSGPRGPRQRRGRENGGRGGRLGPSASRWGPS